MGSVHHVGCAGHSCVFKGPPGDDSAWKRVVVETGLMQREVEAYRCLGSKRLRHLRIAPKCYWSALDEGGALALEDLTPPRATLARFAQGLSHDQAMAAVATLARLHAAFAATGANPPTPYSWLYSARSEGLIAAIATGLEALPRIIQQRLPRGFPAQQLLKLADADIPATLAEAHLHSKLFSLCHGDAWANNILFAPQPGHPPSALLIDWQFAMWGNPLSDVALLLLSSLAPDTRRARTDELLRHYHVTLLRDLAIEYRFKDCRADFARALPFAALVTAATLDAYTVGLTGPELQATAWRMRELAADVPPT